MVKNIFLKEKELMGITQNWAKGFVIFYKILKEGKKRSFKTMVLSLR